MKRVLIITYYWPPSGGSGVQRWVKFAKYLPKEGWQPVIYTPENPEFTAIDRTLAAEIPPEAEVIKRPILEPYGIYKKLLGKKGSEGGEVNPINGTKKNWKQKLSLFIRGNFFIPDPRVFWVRPSVRFLKYYLKEHPVDAIVTTGPPHSMHLIGLGLSKATGLPWLADFRDAWTNMFYYKYLELGKRADEKQHKLEKAVLDNATIVVSVSPFEQKDFQKITSNEVRLMTNGFDPADYRSDSETDEFFNITLTGLFASAGNPKVLWKVLSDKCVADKEFKSLLKIRLIGKTDADILQNIKDAGLGDNLYYPGYQPHEVAVQEQRNASFLLLCLRQEPEYASAVPGKIFEYLASRRPILGIGQTDSIMAKMIRDTSSGVAYDWDDEENIRKWVDFCWDEFKNGELKDNTSDISRYDRRVITRQLAGYLDEMTREKQS
ncbi:MAG: glycosyl transferase family 1 [Bacteroidales bacterium]|nr:glycosyl transferase family 1 [Bacteroidales bacterium]